ncbi:MAG: ion transporter [Pseudomonadota bacterium]
MSSEVKESIEPITINFRAKCQQLLENTLFQAVIIGLIIFNALLLGIETWPQAMSMAGSFILFVDKSILTIFVIEITLRLYVYRKAFWKDPWSIFDLAVVAIALIPSTGSLSVLRAFRVLRVLRLLTAVPSMKKVVGALLSAVPGLSSIAFVLIIIYYVFAVIGTNLFAEAFPEWFGNIALSMYTLFQIMTLESWSMGIARPIMEEYPHAWAFFIPFILIATFTMLNLFIAIIVNAMQTFTEDEKAEMTQAVDNAREHIEDDVHKEVKALREDIAELKVMMEKMKN